LGHAFFAVKVLSNISAEKEKRFKNEYIFCRQNSHQNIVTFWDDGKIDNNFPFIVMSSLLSGKKLIKS